MKTTGPGGASINFEMSGRVGGPAVLMSHSLATDLTMWEFLAEALDEDHQVIRYDARGHGESQAPEGPYDWAMLGGDALAVLDAAGVGRAHFVGLSMGGMIGQWLGARAPDRIASLALCSTTSLTPEAGRAMWDERMELARTHGMAAHVEPTIERWFTDAFRAENPPVIDHVRAMIGRTSIAGFCGWGAAIQGLDFSADLAGIRAPSLVLSAAGDPGTPPAAGEAIAAAIPGARFEVMENASHMSALERPDAFHSAIRAHIAASAG